MAAIIVRASFSSDRYTKISNKAVRDNNLTFQGRGLLFYVGSHKEGFCISERHLVAMTKHGTAFIRSTLAELEEDGYLRRFQERRPDGTWGESMWVVTDMPEVLDEWCAQRIAEERENGREFVPLPRRTRIGVKRNRSKAKAKRVRPHTDAAQAPESAPEEAPAQAQEDAHPHPEGFAADGAPEGAAGAEHEHEHGGQDQDDARFTCSEPVCAEPLADEPHLKKTNTQGGGGGRVRGRAGADEDRGVFPELHGGRRAPVPSAWAQRVCADLVRDTMQRGESLPGSNAFTLGLAIDSAAEYVESGGFMTRDDLVGWLSQGLYRKNGTKGYHDWFRLMQWRLGRDVLRSHAYSWTLAHRGRLEEERRRQMERERERAAQRAQFGGLKRCVAHDQLWDEKNPCSGCVGREVRAQAPAPEPEPVREVQVFAEDGSPLWEALPEAGEGAGAPVAAQGRGRVSAARAAWDALSRVTGSDMLAEEPKAPFRAPQTNAAASEGSDSGVARG